MKKTIIIRVIQIISLLSIFGLILFQLRHINPFAATWDQADFAFGIIRYDMMAMQPHFPGYPYFILGGKLIHSFIENPAEALTIFNILFYSSAVFPIWRLMRNTISKEYSLLLTAIIYSSSYTLTIVNQPMSEGAALASLWWFIWSLYFALYIEEKRAMILPLFIFSILLGIRLSYLPFAIGIVYLFYQKWKTGKTSLKDLMIFAVIAGFFQLVWVGAVAISEGGFISFLKLSLSFTFGHFQDWGGAVSSVDPSMIERVKTFILENIIWSGFSAHSVILLILYFGLFLVYFLTAPWKNFKNKMDLHLPIMLFVCYFSWAYFAQNIDKPRHILPLVGLGCWIVFHQLFKRKTNSFIIILVTAILAVQCLQTAFLIKEQSEKKPAIYQLAEYLTKSKRSIIAYTWEETRVFEYLQVPFLHKKVQTYEFFLHDLSYYSDQTILLTDKVAEGFKLQGEDINKDLEKVGEFHSNKLFDPIYGDITLYKWKKHQGVKK